MPRAIVTSAAQTISFHTLRKAILAALVVALLVFTGGVLFLVNRIFANFGPGVQADLEWKATRGARELAQASELGLAANDAAMTERAFDAFRASDDVVAIVATDAAGKIVASFRQSPEAPVSLFSGAAGAVRRTPGHYVGWANAEIEGAVVGRVALVISTRRLVDSERLLRQIEAIVGVGAALALLFGGLFVVYFTGAIIKRDAQLADHAANLERKVEERTAELDERNRGMRLVLDNVGQGFITIDLRGVMSSERSAIVARWLGEAPAGGSFVEYVARHDAKAADWLGLGLDELAAPMLPVAVLVDQLPKRARVGGRTLSIDYTPLLRGDANVVDRLLVVITDVSAEVERAEMERQQREMLALFQAISTDRGGFLGFLAEATALVETLRGPGEASQEVEQRVVHTLKGNASLYKLDGFVSVCHEAETRMIDEGAALADAHRAAIVSAWDRVRAAASELVGEGVSTLTVDVADYAGVVALARGGAAAGELERALRSWRLEPVKLRLERLAIQTRQLAARLGKTEPEIHVDAGGVRLDGKRWAAFWSAFVHVARNAIDHGLEPDDERARQGKPRAGALWLTTDVEAGEVVVRLEDDGRGIDWDKLARRAAEKGLAHDSRAALERALFADGVTTRDAATVVSGRGVGMAAVKQAVDALGGRIVIRSEARVGTTFELRIPDADVFQDPRAERPVRALRSVAQTTHTGALTT